MKKLLITLSAFLSALTTSAQSKTAMFGDFNNDGKITVTDITHMTNISMGNKNSSVIIGEYYLDGSQAETPDILFGDYNKDGQITAEDIIMLLNISLKEDNAPILGYYLTEEYEGPKQITIYQFGENSYSNEPIIFTLPNFYFNEIFSLVGMSKAEFENIYEPVCYDDHKEVMTQFEVTTRNNKIIQRKPIEWEKTYTEIINSVDDQGTINRKIFFELDNNAQAYIYGKTNHSDTIYVTYKKRTSSIIDLFIPLQLTIKERVSINYGKALNNYWIDDTKDTVTEMDKSVNFNVNYPKDYGNTNTFFLQEFNSEDSIKEDIYGFVRDINDVWEGKTLLFSDKNSYIKEKMPVYYFHPQNKNIIISDEMNNSSYTLDIDYDYLISNEQHISDSISKESPDYVKKAETAFLIDTQYGIYKNTKLYALKEGEERSEKNCIAEMNRYTGKIHYLYNDRAKNVLNASAQFSAYVGIFLPDSQNEDIATPINYDFIPNNIFKIKFLRPISVQSIPSSISDAPQRNYITVFDKLSFTDWREAKFIDFDNTDPYRNVWFYAFYGLNEISFDLGNILIEIEGQKYLLSNVTRSLRFSYVDSDKQTMIACSDNSSGLTTIGSKTISLTSYNKEDAGDQQTYDYLKEHFGYIRYQNNGLNIMNVSVSIPVMISYDWGEIKTYMNITIDGTLANK